MVAIERYLPMSFGSLLLFLFTIYVFVLVGKSIWTNYNSNKSIDSEAATVADMEDDINMLKYQISYYQTASFKEKEARSKLAYKAPGENVMALPYDIQEENLNDVTYEEVKIKTPNYKLWWSFLFES